jgi:FixJ family two-component response regulator
MAAFPIQAPPAFVPGPGSFSRLSHATENRDVLATQAVYLVDVDPQVSGRLAEQLGKHRMDVFTFASAAEYLEFSRTDTSACLILDMDRSDNRGLRLQQLLIERGAPPVVFIFAHAEVPSIVRAIKAGAVEILPKPVDPEALSSAIRSAFALDRTQRRKKAEVASLRDRYSLLTPREREVFPLVVGGLLNKQSASVLGISEITLQTHRARVMRKMEAGSLAELVRTAIKLRIPHCS